MIQIQHLTKRFAAAGATVVALNDINLEIQDGDIYGIIGMSGAGKSTLVRCINMLERPDEGKVIVNGREMMQLSPAELRDARREITMIFQQFNLLMQRTCLKNICFPMELAGVPKDKATARARELLELVGLPDKADAYPAQRKWIFSPAVNSSALPLHERSSTIRGCCCSTSRSAHLTCNYAKKCRLS